MIKSFCAASTFEKSNCKASIAYLVKSFILESNIISKAIAPRLKSAAEVETVAFTSGANSLSLVSI